MQSVTLSTPPLLGSMGQRAFPLHYDRLPPNLQDSTLGSARHNHENFRAKYSIYLVRAQDPKKTDTALILPIQNWYYLQKKQEVIAPQVLTKKIVCMI